MTPLLHQEGPRMQIFYALAQINVKQAERDGTKAASEQPPLSSAEIRLGNVIWELREERSGWLNK